VAPQRSRTGRSNVISGARIVIGRRPLRLSVGQAEGPVNRKPSR
jgi:hypothetical protein